MSGLIAMMWIIVALVASPLVLLVFGAICAWIQDFKISSLVTRFIS